MKWVIVLALLFATAYAADQQSCAIMAGSLVLKHPWTAYNGYEFFDNIRSELKSKVSAQCQNGWDVPSDTVTALAKAATMTEDPAGCLKSLPQTGTCKVTFAVNATKIKEIAAAILQSYRLVKADMDFRLVLKLAYQQSLSLNFDVEQTVNGFYLAFPKDCTDEDLKQYSNAANSYFAQIDQLYTNATQCLSFLSGLQISGGALLKIALHTSTDANHVPTDAVTLTSQSGAGDMKNTGAAAATAVPTTVVLGALLVAALASRRLLF